VGMSRRMSALASDSRVKESALWAVAQRTMGAVRVIQAFTTEEAEHRRFVRTSTESLAATLRLYTFQTAYAAFTSVLIAAGTAAVLWFGATHVLAGRLTVGEVLVFTSYLASLYAPINSLTQTYGLIQGARVGAERVFEILETAPDLSDGPRPTPAQPRAAARLAQLDDFLARLPEGLETVVGEAGATLSAGEQLRITIARAILRDAPLLILDEPTAALDAATEALVMQGL